MKAHSDSPRFLARLAALALCAGLPFAAPAQEPEIDAAPSTKSPQALADEILKDVAELRGLPFKKPIGVENQSIADFEKYLDRQLEKQLPEAKAKNYGKVIHRLGLYRGPIIEDLGGMAKSVMKSQAAAYYDPETSTFYVLMSDMPELMVGTIYSHELYHGLQDQHFDLNKYVMSPVEHALTDDELLARQAVVEGEATYVMTLWAMKRMTGELPDEEAMGMMVGAQAGMDAASLGQMIENGPGLQLFSDDMKDAVKAMEEVPPFMIETLVGAYLKGMAFIHEIKKYGWEKVEMLYEDPPVSTEMILHPEKWLLHETPVRYEWPKFETPAIPEGWEVYDTNTLGEIQWKIIFNEFEMSGPGRRAAEGWNGDSFTVLGRPGTDETVLLLASSWDSEQDAEEFEGAYLDLLKEKYPDSGAPVRVVREGAEVSIVEGGKAEDLPAWTAFLKSIKKTD